MHRVRRVPPDPSAPDRTARMTLAGGDQLDLLAALGVPDPAPVEPPPAPMVDEGELEARRARVARIAFKARQATLLAEVENPPRVSLPVLVPNSDLCGESRDCVRITCPHHAALDVGEPEEVEGKVYRRIVLNTGWREGADPSRGRRPAYNVEEQADLRTWPAFEEEVLAELDAMQAAGFDPCCDRAAKRVRAAREAAEDGDADRATLQRIDDTTMVAIGRVLGVSDESVRIACRSAEEKLRNLAVDGGYSEDGDVSDLVEAILFGAGVE